jgi:photolyase PhrII
VQNLVSRTTTAQALVTVSGKRGEELSLGMQTSNALTKTLPDLPKALAERCRSIGTSTSPRPGGEFVVYWMHHAVRDHDNPALDTALEIANGLSLPVLVYQGLGGLHRFNNDRHHTFILQGARDAHLGLASRGIRAVFHLDPTCMVPTPLHTLSRRAAVVVTEDFPVAPFPAWTSKLGDHAGCLTLAVDCSCIIPMQQHGVRYSRAFAFREASQAAFAERVPRVWQDRQPGVEAFAGDLGFEAVDLAGMDIAALCAACEIDHSVPPVAHTHGGSNAGYERWETFRREGLAWYARSRNDAARAWPRSVSRLSPYLHHGHVSPFRIAREAWNDGSEGAEKFLDELLIWRELAFNFCFHTTDPEQLAALPRWAQDTLSAHADDPRETIHDDETLARSLTGDRLWDLAQTSLRVHGELHNNLRMTWAKAIPGWRPDPEAALRTLVTLNHRYALDGSDPNSYGGLLWTLGLFDRPFPETPVTGQLRSRSTQGHARRLDMAVYASRVTAPACGDRKRIAVIGAGMAGLNAARTLHDQGHDVTVFEKSRGLGGRMATRRVDNIGFDHGAQYFTARDPRFREAVTAWLQRGIVQPWQPRVGQVSGGRIKASPDDRERFVAVPGMSTLGRHLAVGLDVRCPVRVAPPRRRNDGWLLENEGGQALGLFDALVVATPPEQAEVLLRPGAPLVADQVAKMSSAPTWALMLATTASLPLPFDALFFKDGPLAWAARNSSKPGRSGNTWVVHAGQDWTLAHLDLNNDEAAARLSTLFCEALDIPKDQLSFQSAHRWLYALADEPLNSGAITSAEQSLVVCGDWCGGSRIEGAFLSGQAAAGHLLRQWALTSGLAHGPWAYTPALEQAQCG